MRPLSAAITVTAFGPRTRYAGVGVLVDWPEVNGSRTRVVEIWSIVGDQQPKIPPTALDDGIWKIIRHTRKILTGSYMVSPLLRPSECPSPMLLRDPQP